MNCTARRIIKETVGVKKDNRVSEKKDWPVQRILGQNSSITKKATTSERTQLWKCRFQSKHQKNQENTTWQKFILISCMLCTMEMTRVGFPGQPSHSWRLISMALPQITNKTHQHHHHLGISIYYAVKSNTIWILFLKINNFHFQNQYSSSLDSFMGNC